MRAFEHVEVTRMEDWRAWLAAHHTQTDAIWLVTYKKHCPDRYLAYHDLVDEAICQGWIDSLQRRVDADRRKQLYSPRRRGSIWSKLNKDRVERLTAEGRMQPAGQAAIDAARADGSWTLYDECEALIVPPDLGAALDAAGSMAQWAAFAPSSRKAILWWIKSAGRAATREKRIAETARLAALNLRANHPEAKGR